MNKKKVLSSKTSNQNKKSNLVSETHPQLKTNIEQNLKKGDKIIFGLIRADLPKPIKRKSKTENEAIQPKFFKKGRREGNFNTGRWTSEEHNRFIEALLKYGNEWKSVQKHVGSRSSTQARSHAQKFFVKIGKTKVGNMNLDFANNSLKSLNQMANNLDNEQLSNAISMLNKMVYDKSKNTDKYLNVSLER